MHAAARGERKSRIFLNGQSIEIGAQSEDLSRLFPRSGRRRRVFADTFFVGTQLVQFAADVKLTWVSTPAPDLMQRVPFDDSSLQRLRFLILSSILSNPPLKMTKQQ